MTPVVLVYSANKSLCVWQNVFSVYMFYVVYVCIESVYVVVNVHCGK